MKKAYVFTKVKKILACCFKSLMPKSHFIFTTRIHVTEYCG